MVNKIILFCYFVVFVSTFLFLETATCFTCVFVPKIMLFNTVLIKSGFIWAALLRTFECHCVKTSSLISQFVITSSMRSLVAYLRIQRSEAFV